MAPAGDSTTSRGRCRLPLHRKDTTHDDRPAPAGQARVTPAEISDLLGQAPRPAALRAAGRPDRLPRTQSRSCSPGSPPTSTHPRPMRSPPGHGTSYAPWPPSCATRWTEARPMNLSPFSGEQIVQVTNPDPFAKPVLRSPVLHTPVWMIACAQLLRLLWRLIKLLVRHPVAQPHPPSSWSLSWRVLGWPGPRHHRRRSHRQRRHLAARWPASWARLVAGPMRARWRRWHYHRQWPAVMTIARLAVQLPGPAAAARPRPGHLHRLHRPAARPAGVRPVPRRLRPPRRKPRPRVRCAVVPHPHRITRLGGGRAGPPRRPRRGHPGPARPRPH